MFTLFKLCGSLVVLGLLSLLWVGVSVFINAPSTILIAGAIIALLIGLFIAFELLRILWRKEINQIHTKVDQWKNEL